MAWSDCLDDACIVDKRTESDGMGGIVVTWADGCLLYTSLPGTAEVKKHPRDYQNNSGEQ